MGFFSVNEIGQKDTKRNKCVLCGLYRKCETPKQDVSGSGDKKILILNSRISANADNKGKHLAGSDRIKIKSMLKKAGIDFENDCWVLSAVNCHTKTATLLDVENCRNRTINKIKKLNPDLIIAVGIQSIQSLFGDFFSGKTGSIEKWRGFAVPDKRFNCYVCPILEIKHLENDSIDYTITEKDILRAVKTLEKPFVCSDIEEDKKKCKLLRNKKEISDLLEKIAKTDCITAFDYETSGLKPYVKGHFIYSCSVYFKGVSYAFLMSDDIVPALRKYLLSEKAKKIMANIKFEIKWGREILKCNTNSVIFDVCLAPHILDNRGGISSVKFQSFVQLGIADYSSNIVSFLKSTSSKKETGENGFNRIKEAPLEELLIYNALDSLYEYRLYKKQFKQLTDENLIDAYGLFHRASLSLSDVEHNGFYIDEDYFNLQIDVLTKKINRLERLLEKDPIISKWKDKYGAKFNIDSSKQMSDILYNEMGIEPVKFTDKGNPSTDKDALSQMNLSFYEKKLQLDKLKDARGTFIHSILCETSEGRLHPNYNLNTTRTYRSSCNAPNFQNIPVRDPEIKKIIRSGIFAKKGFMIGEFDYSGLEVKIAHCHHKDPVMESYLLDKTKDMHRDVSMDCYKLPLHEMTKTIRFYGKNRFTFAEFYGDYFVNCAKGLWSAISEIDLKTKSGISMRTWLKSKGINGLKQFTNHIKKVEDIFWNKRFKVYSQWKKKNYSDYLKKGFIRTKTGFLLKKAMGKNDANNYPIQGSAFHILLMSLILVNDEFKKRKMKSYVMGQIHDSMILGIHPEEKEEVFEIVKYIMEIKIRKLWKWIIVPLEIEGELTPVNGSWYEKEEIEL